MPAPTITALPAAPQRGDDGPTVFSAKADAFVDALAAFVTECNALAAYLDSLGIDPLLTVRAEAGTTWTIAIDDNGKHVVSTNAAAITVTIPTNASVAVPVGTCMSIEQGGAGKVSLSVAGVTLRKKASAAATGATSEQGAVIALTKVDTDTWVLTGDMELA